MTVLFLLMMFSGQGKELWDQANQSYKDGQYQAAMDSYLALEKQGVENGALFFNLGTTYLKLGKTGKAILYYERALSYKPYDPDLNHNMKLALAARQKQPADGKEDQVEEKIRKFMWAVPYELLFWVCGVFLVLGTLGWFYIFWKGAGPQVRVTVSTIGLLGILVTGVLSYQYHVLNVHDRGVVIQTEAPVRSGPSLKEDVSFTIYEGRRVKILNRSQGWMRVRLSNGYNGWLPESAVGVI